MSWGPVCWVLLWEIVPMLSWSAMAIAVAAQWLATCFVSWTFPMIDETPGW
ncbi:MFS transporter [Escherichia coli]